MNERKKVKIFCRNFKYEGELIDEDKETYTILDIREGKIILPKQNSIVYVLEDRE